MPSRLTYSIIFGFAVGILIESFSNTNKFFLLLLFFTSIVFLFVGYFLKRFKNTALLACVFLVSILFGIIRFSLNQKTPTSFSNIGEEVSISGIIIDEVETREKDQRFVILDDLNHEKILVTTDLYPKYHYGDKVLVTGKLKSPSNFDTDSGREFDYINYLAKDEIFYTMSFANVLFVSHEPESKIKEILFRFKESIEKNISNVVPKPESQFLSGITLGSRSGLSSQLKDKFIKTGTIHIVALSGYNISIVAKGIQQFFIYFLSYYASIALGVISIFLFVLMTGASSTAVRAGIMAILVLLSKATGRKYEISIALFIAGFLMILHDPMTLAFDVSFQLSFLATLGIIYLNPIFEKIFGKKDNEKPPVIFLQKVHFGFRDILSTTLSAQIAVLPFIIYKMGILSLVSFPVNIFILPLIPIAMYLGFAVGVLGYVGTWISMPFGFIAYKILEFILWIIDLGSRLPRGSMSVYVFPLWLCLFLYILIITATLSFYRKQKDLTV